MRSDESRRKGTRVVKRRFLEIERGGQVREEREREREHQAGEGDPPGEGSVASVGEHATGLVRAPLEVQAGDDEGENSLAEADSECETHEKREREL